MALVLGMSFVAPQKIFAEIDQVTEVEDDNTIKGRRLVVEEVVIDHSLYRLYYYVTSKGEKILVEVEYVGIVTWSV